MRPLPAIARRRGRPRLNIPTGTWIDSDVLPRRVAGIVGDRDEREDIGALGFERLCRLAERLTGIPLSRERRKILYKLTFTDRAKASVIVRQLTAWRFGVGERDVRRMIADLHMNDGARDDNGDPKKPRPRVKLIYR